MNQDFDNIGNLSARVMADLNINEPPENPPGMYACYSVNGQRFWRWKPARAMAIAIEALKLEPHVTVLAFGWKGWECVFQKVPFAADFGSMDTTAMQAGTFGAAHTHSINAGIKGVANPAAGMHSHSFIGQNKP